MCVVASIGQQRVEEDRPTVQQLLQSKQGPVDRGGMWRSACRVAAVDRVPIAPVSLKEWQDEAFAKAFKWSAGS